MIALLLTFEETKNGCAFNSVALTKPEYETDMERVMAKSVDLALKVIQEEMGKAMSDSSTVIEGKNIEDLARKYGKTIGATAIEDVCKKIGIIIPKR